MVARQDLRNTPAYTGTTSSARARAGWCLEYPRAHGDYDNQLNGPIPQTGIPPCTRGLRLYREVPVLSIGNTPAYTGTTGLHCGVNL